MNGQHTLSTLLNKIKFTYSLAFLDFLFILKLLYRQSVINHLIRLLIFYNYIV